MLAISITVFVLLAVFKKKRDDQHEESICDSRCSKHEDKLKAMNRNSWVDGRHGTFLAKYSNHGSRFLGMAEKGDAQSGAIPMVEDDSAILSWKDLSCTYPSKKSGQEDIMTLSEVTGHVKSRELVSIMVCVNLSQPTWAILPCIVDTQLIKSVLNKKESIQKQDKFEHIP